MGDLKRASRIMNESQLWDFLRPKLQSIKRCHYSRIESGETSPGFPDLDVCIEGIGGYIEMKHINGRENRKNLLRPSQYRWICDRIEAGETNIWILVSCNMGKGRVFFLLVHGSNVGALIRTNRLDDWTAAAREILTEDNLVDGILRNMCGNRR